MIKGRGPFLPDEHEGAGFCQQEEIVSPVAVAVQEEDQRPGFFRIGFIALGEVQQIPLAVVLQCAVLVRLGVDALAGQILGIVFVDVERLIPVQIDGPPGELLVAALISQPRRRPLSGSKVALMVFLPPLHIETQWKV